VISGSWVGLTVIKTTASMIPDIAVVELSAQVGAMMGKPQTHFYNKWTINDN
jgi:uncharacterized protein YchJ